MILQNFYYLSYRVLLSFYTVMFTEKLNIINALLVHSQLSLKVLISFVSQENIN